MLMRRFAEARARKIDFDQRYHKWSCRPGQPSSPIAPTLIAFLLLAGIPQGTGMSQAISLSQERSRFLQGFKMSKKEGGKSQ